MRILSIGFSFGLLLALACGGPELRSFAPIPLDLESVRARHAPPNVIVADEEHTRPTSGGACGHSPLCVIVLPVLLYDAVFPERWRELTVDEGGQRTLTASYSQEGSLIQARLRGETRWQDYRTLRLEQLGQELIVEVSSAPLDGPDQTVKSPILPQVDLLADYAALLEKTHRPDNRAAAIIEAWTWLDEEAWPLVEERMGDPAEADLTRAGVLRDACARGVGAPLLPLVQRGPALETAVAALGCGSRELVFGEAVTDGICADDGVPLGNFKELGRIQDATELREGLAPRIAACPAADGRALLLDRFGLPLDLPTVQATFALDSKRARAFASDIDPGWPALRPAFAAGLAGPHRHSLMAAADGTTAFIPTATEGVALVQGYLEPGHGLQLGRTGDLAVALSLLSRMPPTDLAALLPFAGEGEDLEHHALRVILGQPEHQLPLARELASYPLPVDSASAVGSEARLANFVLVLGGCTTTDSLKAARAAALAAPEGQLGQVCSATRP